MTYYQSTMMQYFDFILLPREEGRLRSLDVRMSSGEGAARARFEG